MADPDSASLYNMELAYATSTALGMALELPAERVISAEGDGSMLAALGVLATITRYRPANLTVLILVNGIYGTGDNNVRTQTGLGGNLGGVALALGWDATHVNRVATADELRARLVEARSGAGPWLIEVTLDAGSTPRAPAGPGRAWTLPSPASCCDERSNGGELPDDDCTRAAREPLCGCRWAQDPLPRGRRGNAPDHAPRHGPGSVGLSNFRGTVPAFAGDYRVIVPDLPRYGKSSKIAIRGPASPSCPA